MTSIWPKHMPPAVAAMHGTDPHTTARGVARVDRGTGLVARAIARVVGFPRTAVAVPLAVEIARDAQGETWTRHFGDQHFTSRMTHRDGRVVEHFGPLAFAFDLVPIAGGHAMQLRRWWCGSLPLPLAFAPRITASETDDDGRFAFDVRVVLPLCGLLVAYRGSLAIVVKALDPAEWSLSDEHRPARRHRR